MNHLLIEERGQHIDPNSIPTACQQWDLKIKPRNGLLNLPFKAVWHYRDLLLLLVRRDFVATYKQTILGPLWFFIQPLLTTIMFTIVFGRMGGFSTDGLPQPLFYLAGITAWNYFADCLTKTANVFRDNAGIFGKVFFPRLIVPLSIVVSNLVRFSIQFCLLIILIFWYSFTGVNLHFGWGLALFPIVILLMALLGLGGGMIITSLTTKYRDLAFALTFGVQLMMYATTVVYPLSSINAKYKWVVIANPMTTLIETFRYSLLGKGSFSWTGIGITAAVTFLILFFGLIIFNKIEKDFIDTI